MFDVVRIGIFSQKKTIRQYLQLLDIEVKFMLLYF
jgi:hypothetical protein